MGADARKLREGLPVTGYGHGPTTPNHQERSWRRSVLVKLILLSGVVCGIHAVLSRPPSPFMRDLLRHSASDGMPKADTSVSNFEWSTLTPSDVINWMPCFDEYQCARLILPLDYLSPPGYGPNVTIALAMLPANDPANARGTILINPGGPGGSGTDFVKQIGKSIMRISGGSYNILGFDPRGTGASTPSAQCFDTDSQYKIWSLQAGQQPLNLSDGSVPFARARETVLAKRCEEVLGGIGKEAANGSALEWGSGRFMSTSSVATDMLEITERLGEEKLKYWGFSYGSVLGQYFSAMYPDKIERLVIDGVFDSYNYRNTSWNSNLIDTDAVWASLPTFCHQAGPSKCPLYKGTPEAIQARVDAILNGLHKQPLAIPFAPAGPYVITYKAAHYYAFRAAYSPLAQYPGLAQALVAIEQNNQSALEGMEEKFGAGVKCQSNDPSPWSADTEAFNVIACGDGEPLTYTDEHYRAWFEDLAATSTFASDYWATLYLRCSEWHIRPKWRYTGPLAATNTSHPLLVISPRYDTVCPLTDAKRVHERYSSGLLVQNSYGHCSPAAPSLCTARYVQAYFENGTLPEPGTVCEVDELPFIGAVHGGARSVSVEDRETLDALRRMGEAIPVMGGF